MIKVIYEVGNAHYEKELKFDHAISVDSFEQAVAKVPSLFNDVHFKGEQHVAKPSKKEATLKLEPVEIEVIEDSSIKIEE